MGLFSSSTKYYAYAGSSYLLPAEDREHTVKSLMLQSALTGQSTMSEAIIMGLQTDMYRRVRKMAKYAADPDGYPYGFPSVTHIVYNLSTTFLRPFIEADVGAPIDYRSLHWGEFQNPIHQTFWLEMLINQHYLDPAYFNWTAPIGDPVDTNWSPVDTSVEVPVAVTEQPPTADRWALSNNQYTVVPTGNLRQVSFPYSDVSWNAGTASYDPVSGTYNVLQPFDLAPYNNTSTWIQVRYRFTGETDIYRYWYYEIGSGLYPALEDAITSIRFDAEYLPIAVLMHDTVWFDEQNSPELEDGLDRLLKYITLDPLEIKEDFLDAIANPDPETPPDQIPQIEDIWDFFVQFGMPLRTNDQAGLEYLWYFYQFLGDRNSWTFFDDYNAWAASSFGEQPSSNLSIEEGEMYTGYIARYAWSYVHRVDITGQFTPPGWSRPLKTREYWSQEYKVGDPDYAFGLDLVHGAGNYNIASGTGDGVENTYTIIVRQNALSDSLDGQTSTYSPVLMMGPSMEYQINTSDTPVGVGDGGYVDFQYRFVDVEIFPDDPEEDSEFRWPINIGVLKQMSAMRREPALQEALASTVFLVDKVKVKWYQKGFFKWLIVIIAIIVVILTYQYHLLSTVSTLASTALAAGATATAIAFAALYVTMVFALGFLISFAGTLIGGTAGRLFVILASMYLAGGFNFVHNIGTSWGSMTTNFGWGSATNFIRTINPILEIGRMIVEERGLAKLNSDMRDFTQTAREKYEELENAWAELGTPTWLDPLDLVGAFQRQWYVEKPDDYYERVLNANPGILGYDMVNKFSELALQIPADGNPGEFIQGMFNDMERQRGAA